MVGSKIVGVEVRDLFPVDGGRDMGDGTGKGIRN